MEIDGENIHLEKKMMWTCGVEKIVKIKEVIFSGF